MCSVRTWALPTQSWACAGWVSLVLSGLLCWAALVWAGTEFSVFKLPRANHCHSLKFMERSFAFWVQVIWVCENWDNFLKNWVCWFGNAGKHFCELCCTTWIFFQILNTKLGGVIDQPGGCATIQRDLQRLDKWAGRELSSLKGNAESCLWQGTASGTRTDQGLTSKTSSRKGPGCPAGHKVDHKPAMCHYGQSGHQPPGLP